MPVNRNSSSFLSGVQSSLGGLGLAAGIAGLGDASNGSEEPVVILQSRALFDNYATKQNLLPVLFDTLWNPDTKSWKVPPDKTPTLRRAYSLFDKSIRTVTEDRKMGTVTLSMTWKDRALAVKWVKDFIQLVNDDMRTRAERDALAHMQYLSDQMAKTTEVSAVSALTTAYEKQLETFMFAHGNPEYSFHVIDPPTIPDVKERVRPNRPLIAITGLFVGLMLGVGFAYFLEWLRAAAPQSASRWFGWLPVKDV